MVEEMKLSRSHEGLPRTRIREVGVDDDAGWRAAERACARKRRRGDAIPYVGPRPKDCLSFSYEASESITREDVTSNLQHRSVSTFAAVKSVQGRQGSIFYVSIKTSSSL
jgi:hypothetical protein